VNVLLLASHAVAEYDDVRMFHDLGFDVFCPGGYEDPRTGTEGIRPPLPQVPFHEDLAQRCREQREAFGEPGPAIDWAKARLHDDIIDWADVIIVHHFPQVWIQGQWTRIRHKRVIWRTCGQSDPQLEEFMAQMTRPLAGGGHLEVVRYSPKERQTFEAMGQFAGEDALIRFGKYPDDYGPYIGDWEVVGNVTQDMVARGDSVGLPMWQRITEGLPTKPAGKGSEALGGVGILSYEDMLDYLRHIRVYLYTGTKPAPYTLGLIEAMLSGVPVVAVGLAPTGLHDAWLRDISEGEDIACLPWMRSAHVGMHGYPDPGFYLEFPDIARRDGEAQRQTAIELFSIDTIGAQWREFLS
jgi:glycosyltransferase involved in cell wall biosynthesis